MTNRTTSNISPIEFFNNLLMLDPNDAEALAQYVLMLSLVRHNNEALRFVAQLSALEPFVPRYRFTSAIITDLGGQSQAAIRMYEALPPDADGGYYRNAYLAARYAADGC